MEGAGLALGIAGLAGLFSACIDSYHLIQRGISFDKDYKILQTKFDNQELRLYSWGIACGLTGETTGYGPLNIPEVHHRVDATLRCISTLIQEQIELRKKYELDSSGAIPGNDNLLSTTVNGPGELSRLSPRFSLGTFFRRRKQQQQQQQRKLGIIDSARWAVDDRTKFTELVQHLKDFNDDLESLTRSTDVASRQRVIVEYEIEEIEDLEVLEEVELAGHDGPDIISETASIRLASLREGSIRTTTSGYSRNTSSFRTARSSLSVRERLSIEFESDRLFYQATAGDSDSDDDRPSSEPSPHPAAPTATEVHRTAAAVTTFHGRMATNLPPGGNVVPVIAAPSASGKPMYDPNRAYKLLAIGSQNCGTTDLLTVFSLGYWPTGHRPTDFKDYVTSCRVDSTPLKILLVDTAGEEQYTLLRRHKYAKTEVILLCFVADRPLADAKSELENTWLSDVHESCRNVPIILVGIQDPDAIETSRNGRNFERVLRQQFASSIGASKYLWCDPRTGEGVDDVFETASRALLRKYRLPPQPRKKSRLSTLFRNLRDINEEAESATNEEVVSRD